MKKQRRNKFWMVTEAREYCESLGLPDPLRKFNSSRANAERRGIEWCLTFDEWWTLWRPHYHDRGEGPNKLNLCRECDQGAYEIGNVRIDTFKANVKENGKILHLSAKARHSTRHGKGKYNPFAIDNGYIKHIFPLPIELMDPMKILMAKQELEAVLREAGKLEPPKYKIVYITK